MTVRLGWRIGVAAAPLTIAGRMSCASMPWPWCASIMPGPTLAAEKLEERHDVRVSRETLRSWMIQAGLWLPRAERKPFQQPRHRREHLGELIQIDGTAGLRTAARPALSWCSWTTPPAA